jgi:hypothetical protein
MQKKNERVMEKTADEASSAYPDENTGKAQRVAPGPCGLKPEYQKVPAPHSEKALNDMAVYLMWASLSGLP